MRRTQLKFARTMIYNLKRRYGVPVDLYRTVSSTIDDETGRTQVVKIKYHIRHLIQLPSGVNGMMAISGQYKNPSPNFPSQDIDVTTTSFILDQRDVPPDFQLSQDDYFVVHRQVTRVNQSGQRYNISKDSQLEDGIGYLIDARYMLGGQRNEVFDVDVDEIINLSNTATTSISYQVATEDELVIGETCE